MSVLLLLIGLLLFVGLVVAHELGHFLTARRNGVEVEEFGIGFPPRAWSKKMPTGFILSLNWLPLGGFVRLKGEHDADKRKGSFGAAPLRAKVKIMLAGVFMNLIVAYVMLVVLALIGMPRLIENQYTLSSDTKVVRQDTLVGYIEDNSPASAAGLKLRDRIIAVGSPATKEFINSADQLPAITKQHAGQAITIEVERDGAILQLVTTLRDNQEVEASKQTDDPKGYLGVSPTEYVVQRSTWSAPIVAAGLIKQFTEATFKGLGTAISNIFQGDTAKASEQVSGPVGIFVLLKDGSLLGLPFILMIIALISLTLAIMNVLPIPALDGGRLFITLLFRILHRPLSVKAEEWIHGTGFALLMLLFVLITVVDVRRFF